MQESGVELSVADVSVRRRLSFLDYMAGGCEIQCMLAVDFSSNNAPIDNPSSFHYAGEQSCSKRKVSIALASFPLLPQLVLCTAVELYLTLSVVVCNAAIVEALQSRFTLINHLAFSEYQHTL